MCVKRKTHKPKKGSTVVVYDHNQEKEYTGKVVSLLSTQFVYKVGRKPNAEYRYAFYSDKWRTE